MNKQQALNEVKAVEERLKELKRIIESNDKTLDDIISYEQACLILDEMNYADKISDYDKLLLIIKATNFIDNDYKIWVPNFDNSSEYKYLPYFERKAGGWSLGVVFDGRDYATCPVGLYFKKEQSARVIANRFILLYKKVLG